MIRWYFAVPGAKCLPFPTLWGSSDFCDLNEQCEANIGEIPRFNAHTQFQGDIPFWPMPEWNNGAAPQGATGQKFCGTQTQFQTAAPWSTSLPFVTLGPTGLPTCCVPLANASLVLSAMRLPNASVVLAPEIENLKISIVLASGNIPSARLVMSAPMTCSTSLALNAYTVADGWIALASPEISEPTFANIVLAGSLLPEQSLVLAGVPSTAFGAFVLSSSPLPLNALVIGPESVLYGSGGGVGSGQAVVTQPTGGGGVGGGAVVFVDLVATSGGAVGGGAAPPLPYLEDAGGGVGGGAVTAGAVPGCGGCSASPAQWKVTWSGGGYPDPFVGSDFVVTFNPGYTPPLCQFDYTSPYFSVCVLYYGPPNTFQIGTGPCSGSIYDVVGSWNCLGVNTMIIRGMGYPGPTSITLTPV